MNITSYEANKSPTHFRGPPPNGRYLKERITVLLACKLHYSKDKLLPNVRHHPP